MELQTPSVSGTSPSRPCSPAVPCLQTLMLSTPVPGQFPAGTQKPALAGFTEVLANTMEEGTKRNVGTPATAPELSYTRNRDLQGSRARSARLQHAPSPAACVTLLMPVCLPRFAFPPPSVWNLIGSDQQTHISSSCCCTKQTDDEMCVYWSPCHYCMLCECWYLC